MSMASWASTGCNIMGEDTMRRLQKRKSKRGAILKKLGYTTQMIQTMLTFPAIDPEIFSVSLLGIELALRWYALAYIVGILIGWFIVVRAVSTPALWAGNRPPLTREQVEDLVFWIILGISWVFFKLLTA